MTIVEVGPRDGFQALASPVPTEMKASIARRLYAAGFRRVEIGSFVSGSAVPQLADTPAVLAGLADLTDFDLQVLVPTERRAAQALAAGAKHLAFVLSVSGSHNRGNVLRDPHESAQEYARIVAGLPRGIAMRLNIATAFDCPFEGRIAIEQTLALLDRLVDVMPSAEIALCDTTGRVTPDHVRALFEAGKARFPQARAWAFHGHDTYGMGIANVLAAYDVGVSVIDASFAGLGGCPFAPGATGNVATEDVVWTSERMGIETGIRLDGLLEIAAEIAMLPDAPIGGRVRHALAARACLSNASGHA
jgi:hydroxymethylglutaryl-CoA lyase